VGQERATPVARTPGITLEEMVREELRPMLKQWLDENLAPMVERLVRAEIERVMAQAR
jgi:cell pole-organizing protein PopZ